MIGLGFTEHGGLEKVGWVDIPAPEPGPGEVRIRIRAGALNRLDRFVLEGIAGVPIARPHVSGSDGSGLVDRVGPGVDGWTPGRRVLLNPGLWDGVCEACLAGEESLCRKFQIVGEHTQGTLTEFVVVPARNVHPLPDRLSFEEGASAPLVFQTAWRAIVGIGALRDGESVGIVGAGGGVATAAIQIARLRGGRVAVVTRSEEKGHRAEQLGAEAVLVPSEARPMEKLLWEWSGKRGVDLILDSVGVETVPRSVKALARGGRVVVIGATTGPIVPIDLRTLFWRQGSIRGSTMANRREFGEVLAELARGTVRPVVDQVLPWGQAPEAFRRLDSPELFGKVVVRGPPD